MTYSFDPASGLVVVPTRVVGRDSETVARLALDTGATGTMLSQSVLMMLGYDPAATPDRVHITTGSGIEYTAKVTVAAVGALGRTIPDFPLLCHTLPPSAGVDGLLRLDFFRETRLMIDFRIGQIALD